MSSPKDEKKPLGEHYYALKRSALLAGAVCFVAGAYGSQAADVSFAFAGLSLKMPTFQLDGILLLVTWYYAINFFLTAAEVHDDALKDFAKQADKIANDIDRAVEHLNIEIRALAGYVEHRNLVTGQVERVLQQVSESNDRIKDDLVDGSEKLADAILPYIRSNIANVHDNSDFGIGLSRPAEKFFEHWQVRTVTTALNSLKPVLGRYTETHAPPSDHYEADQARAGLAEARLAITKLRAAIADVSLLRRINFLGFDVGSVVLVLAFATGAQASTIGTALFEALTFIRNLLVRLVAC